MRVKTHFIMHSEWQIAQVLHSTEESGCPRGRVERRTLKALAMLAHLIDQLFVALTSDLAAAVVEEVAEGCLVDQGQRVQPLA